MQRLAFAVAGQFGVQQRQIAMLADGNLQPPQAIGAPIETVRSRLAEPGGQERQLMADVIYGLAPFMELREVRISKVGWHASPCTPVPLGHGRENCAIGSGSWLPSRDMSANPLKNLDC